MGGGVDLFALADADLGVDLGHTKPDMAK